MNYKAEILKDSINVDNKIRLTTMLVRYPLIVHAEMCRHRAFSRSVASNRAIPTKRILDMVKEHPFIPIYWGKNQKGMQSFEEVEEHHREKCKEKWLYARNCCMSTAESLSVVNNVHKQIANRLLAPFQWVTEILTATEWANFFALRCHSSAQPEIRKIAEMMREVYTNSIPVELVPGEWHLPLVLDDEIKTLSQQECKIISAARVARTSYITSDGLISSLEQDFELFKKLVGSYPKHLSPLEHQAMAVPANLSKIFYLHSEDDEFNLVETLVEQSYGNLKGWIQQRYEFFDQNIV